MVDLYQTNSSITIEEESEKEEEQELVEVESKQKFFQLHSKYIFSQIKSGYILIDQNKAHERILYEQFLKTLSTNEGVTQQQLFPISVEFTSGDFAVLEEIWDEVQLIGFDIEKFGNQSIAVNGVPADLRQTDIPTLFEEIIEQFKNNKGELKLNTRESIARAMAKSMAIKNGKKLRDNEMVLIIDQLFACEAPYFSPTGKKTVITITLDELEKLFS